MKQSRLIKRNLIQITNRAIKTSKPFAFFMIGFALFLPALYAKSNLYQVYSLDDQFIVFSEKPTLAQEAALEAESVRKQLFEELGWISYGEYPTQIWLNPLKEGAQFDVTMAWKGTGWAKKLVLPAVPEINNEILPREVIRIFLKEYSLQRIKDPEKHSPKIPLWLVEGFRLKTESFRKNIPTSNLMMEVDDLFGRNVPFKEAVKQQQYAQLSLKFLNFLLSLPNGHNNIKAFIRALPESKNVKKTFFKIYSKRFNNFQELKFAWNQKWYEEKNVSVRESSGRREVILQYLDALEDVSD